MRPRIWHRKRRGVRGRDWSKTATPRGGKGPDGRASNPCRGGGSPTSRACSRLDEGRNGAWPRPDHEPGGDDALPVDRRGDLLGLRAAVLPQPDRLHVCEIVGIPPCHQVEPLLDGGRVLAFPDVIGLEPERLDRPSEVVPDGYLEIRGGTGLLFAIRLLGLNIDRGRYDSNQGDESGPHDPGHGDVHPRRSLAIRPLVYQDDFKNCPV